MDKENEYKETFLKSWNSIEEFYKGHFWLTAIQRELLLEHDEETRLHYGHLQKRGEKILDFIEILRNKGYDTKTRAGQSLHHLLLSRSKEHGLWSHQKFVSFRFPSKNEGDETMVIDIYENEALKMQELYLSDGLEKILEELLDQPIN